MPDWKHDLQIEAHQLNALLDEKERLEVKIAKQRQRVAALEVLVASDDGPSPDALSYIQSIVDLEGLTDACRTVLRGSRREWMTIAEVQAGLKELGFPLNKYKAPAGSITTTVNRLVKAGEVATDRPSARAMFQPREPEDLREFMNLPEQEKITQTLARTKELIAAKYKWLGPRYGAATSLANQMADRELEKMKASHELSAAVQRRIDK
jgi:hypothetical protein